MKYSSRLKKKKDCGSAMGVLIEHRGKKNREQKGVKGARNNFLTSFSDLI